MKSRHDHVDRRRKLPTRRHPSRTLFAHLRLYALLPPPGSARPRCSVLIPARNEEANIAAAVRSVLRSDGTELEIIVLDDGSTDRTAKIVRVFTSVAHHGLLQRPWPRAGHACALTRAPRDRESTPAGATRRSGRRYPETCRSLELDVTKLGAGESCGG